MQMWGARGTVAAVGVAVVIAGIGGAAVHAATASGPGFGGPGFGGPGFGGPPHGGPPQDRSNRQTDVARGALHGEFVVSTSTDGFATKLTQTGQVTETAPSSVTVRSADGFTTTYVLPPGATQPSAGVGDDVAVQATRDGQSAVVQSITRNSPPGAGG